MITAAAQQPSQKSSRPMAKTPATVVVSAMIDRMSKRMLGDEFIALDSAMARLCTIGPINANQSATGLHLLVEGRFVSQDLVVVLRESVCLVANILQQPKSKRMPVHS